MVASRLALLRFAQILEAAAESKSLQTGWFRLGTWTIWLINRLQQYLNVSALCNSFLHFPWQLGSREFSDFESLQVTDSVCTRILLFWEHHILSQTVEYFSVSDSQFLWIWCPKSLFHHHMAYMDILWNLDERDLFVSLAKNSYNSSLSIWDSHHLGEKRLVTVLLIRTHSNFF